MRAQPCLLATALAFAITIGLTGPTGLAMAQNSETTTPNFVVVLVDDLGWKDLGCYGASYYETPHIDQLAADGVRFTEAYAAAAVCSPTRAALLTGRYPARIGITDWMRMAPEGTRTDRRDPPTDAYENVGEGLLTPRNPYRMELEEQTIAELLTESGYITGQVGKWHLGAEPWYPDKQGFAFHRGGSDLGQPPNYFFPFSPKSSHRLSGFESGPSGQYLTDREAEEATAFIRRNHAKPFFLFLSHYAVHTPIQAKKDLKAHFDKKPRSDQKNPAYAAMIASVDQSVGRVLAELDAQGLRENTLVILTSDNGGLASVTNNAPLRGGKGNPYEGGIRVPLIARWPGMIPAGSTSNVPVSSIDIFPTMLDAASLPIPEEPPIDGESLLGVMEGRDELTREGLFWHFPHFRGRDATPYSMVRQGDYKLIRFYDDGHLELYDLAHDPSEQQNLATREPERAKQLDVLLSKWLLGVGAKIPKPAPGPEDRAQTN
ncbi:MAG: sulfatase [Planctomycetota bacterium]|nr:sulfatase [Planctomycetota bacterium]